MTSPVIDTLQLDIIVNMPSGVVTRINNLHSSLSKLYTLLQGIKGQDFSNVSSSLIQLSNAITPLATSLSSLSSANKNLSGLSTRLKTLNSNLTAIDPDLFIKKFSQMTVAITPFVDKIKEAESALIALNGVIGKTNAKNLSSFSASNAKSTTVFAGGKVGRSSRGGLGSFFSKIYTFYFAITLAKRLGQSLGNVVQKGIDYEETLNLWQVAMKGNVDQAKKFVSEIGKAYGISDEITMRYQATFKNMLSALGQINQEVAYGLSETLTQMALDYSSLYNTTVESAMIKFQSALAGQVRPIRSESGYDITENTLFQLYQDIGGTKTIRQLSQTEKRLLRILAIYNQMKDTARGDLANTITSTANQMRVMSEQGKQFVTWIGVAGNLWIKNSEILIKINGYLYAAAAVAKAYAFSIGYVEKNAIEDPFGDMEQSAQDANKEIGELQGKLLGFDKFQVLSTAETGDGADISAEITKAMTDMQSILSNAVNPAYEKSLEILKSWGLELDENGDIVGGLDTIIEKVKGIGKGISGIFIFIGLMKKPWLVLVGAIEHAYWTNEDFRNSFNDMIKAVSSAGITIFGNFVEILKDITPALTAIVGVFSDVISFSERIGLLEFAIWGVVNARIAWKTAQAAINIMKFYKTIVNYLVPAITSASLAIRKQLASAIAAAQLNFGKFGLAMTALTAQTLGFAAAIGLAFAVFTNWEYMNGVQKWISVIGILTVAALSAAIAFGAFHSAWSLGLAIGGISAGIIAVIAAVNSAKANIDSMEVPKYANGGLATKGSLFLAGEAGPELVTQTSGGGSTIMNMKQLEDAIARGQIRAAAATQGKEGQQITVNVGARKLFDILVNEAKSNGYEFVKVR